MDMLKGRSCFFYSVVVCSFIDIFDIFVNNFMNGLMGGGEVEHFSHGESGTLWIF